jgi:hypothetical protein
MVAGGCIISGKGGITPVTLPTTGTYTVIVDPRGHTTGTARLRLHA